MVKIQTDTRREYKMEKKRKSIGERGSQTLFGRETTRMNYRKNKIYIE